MVEEHRHVVEEFIHHELQQNTLGPQAGLSLALDLGDWDKELDRDGWTGLAFLIRVSGRCQVHGLHCTVPGQCHVMLLLCSSAQQQSKYRTGVPIYARGQKKDKSIPLTPVF